MRYYNIISEFRNNIYFVSTCLRSASACINCEQEAFACSQAAANMNDPSMNEHAITVNAAILAIWTAVGRVLSLYAYKMYIKASLLYTIIYNSQ